MHMSFQAYRIIVVILEAIEKIAFGNAHVAEMTKPKNQCG
jgi:hypothetical protein